MVKNLDAALKFLLDFHSPALGSQPASAPEGSAKRSGFGGSSEGGAPMPDLA
jgi:hypothetical protein